MPIRPDLCFTGMGLELRHVRAFLAIAEEPSITRAAARLHITQPALSRTLRRLEEEIGAVLVERSTRSLRLTPTGEAFRDRCRAVLAAVDDALAVSGPLRPLRLGHAWAAAGGQTTELLRAWSRAHPDQPLHVRQVADRTAGLAGGEVDVALLRGPVDDPALHVRLLREEPRVAAMAPDCRLADRTEVVLADLAGEPVVLNRQYGTTTLQLWPATGRPARTVDVGDTDEWLTAIALGRGVGVTPASTAFFHSRPDVRYVPVRDAPPVPLLLAWRRSSIHPALPDFLRLAADVLGGDRSR
jgi:DNA-binding transcriptional LysR family regulator